MYTDWFELTDRPFAITPDPRFLYLSEPHREALAHLLYGVTESGGFIQLTGEVGTGKTTLTRTLLEQVPDNVDAALVYNAHASLTEFLETICDELGVPRPHGTTTPKSLTDALNSHLLDAHARGRRTVLIVDEAQNLDAELLEQVRLLTNLETHREKLLQILLIGQPELRDTLARNDLRQLAQRITARYHLDPLDEAATVAYVRHRLEVAGARRALFTKAAMRAVHRVSGGIPRLINIICDRALLGAYAERAHEVDADMVRAAAHEVRGAQVTPSQSRAGIAWTAIAAVFVLAVVGVFAATRSPELPAPPVVAESPPPQPQSLPQEVAPVEAPMTLDQLLSVDDDLSATSAALLEAWGVPAADGLPGTLCETAESSGLACVRGRGTWNNLRILDRPALLELRHEGRTHTVLLTGLDGGEARLWRDGDIVQVPVLTLDAAWLGEYLLLWAPPEGTTGILRVDSRGPGVVWLREALQRWSGGTIPAGPDPERFDATLQTAVREFQNALGLDVDGIAGEQTMVHLDGLTHTDGPRLYGEPDVVDP